MPFVVGEALLATEFAKVKPSITTWSRLEPLPTTADLGPSLEARVADPLWFLYRQWAFGELHGEDAGTPIEVRMEGEKARLSRYHPGRPLTGAHDRAVDYDHERAPLEVTVERERIRGAHPRLSLAAGLQLVRMLSLSGLSRLVPGFAEEFVLSVETDVDKVVDQAGAAWSLFLEGRAVDGAALSKEVRALRDAGGDVEGSPIAFNPPLSAADAGTLESVLTDWIRWYDGFFEEPLDGEAAAWNPNRQEYAMALAAEMSDGRVVLRAEEYTDGRLDWHSFLASALPNLGEAAGSPGAESVIIPPTLPTPVRYPGMPADRYWEFEDSAVNLGSLVAGPSDLSRTLLVEFGLVFGTDWFIVPMELPVGSVFRIDKLEVRDTFGMKTHVGPSRNPDGRPWEMYELGLFGSAGARLQDLFFLPPTISGRLEGEPIEEVAFLRDEMANLAWAVEHRVPGASGEPYERQLEAGLVPLRQKLDVDPGDAELIYRLATPVPVNWIPFTPVPAGPANAGFSVQLERRRLTQILQDGTETDGQPRGMLLRSDPAVSIENDTLKIEDEEVPRDGAVVTRSFQYARWIDGGSFLWVGRAKRVGRGMGSSGLRWDIAEPRGG